MVRLGSRALDHTLPGRRRNLPWQRQQRIIAKLIARHGAVVQSGPFAGQRLPEEGSWGNFAPLLIGSYEAELHDVIEELVELHPRRVVNVGCAEGYYATGFARRLPEAEVYAFDVDVKGQRLTTQSAAMNDVADRVHVAEECTTARLEALLGRDAVLVIDCEGCELDLLRPDLISSLRDTTVLAELHDFVDAKISATVLARFKDTHVIRIVRAVPRLPEDHPAVAELKPSDQAVALDERRPTEPHPMEFALLRPT